MRQPGPVETAAGLNKAQVHVAAPAEFDFDQREPILRNRPQAAHAADRTEGGFNGTGDVFFYIAGVQAETIRADHEPGHVDVGQEIHAQADERIDTQQERGQKADCGRHGPLDGKADEAHAVS